jgi:hypothetical protein
MKQLIKHLKNEYCRICGKPTFDDGCLNCDRGICKNLKGTKNEN